MIAQNTQATITPDVMAGGNESWASYLTGGAGGQDMGASGGHREHAKGGTSKVGVG